MKRKASIYIKDIIEAIDKINEFIQDMNFESFVNDDKTSSAVIRKIEIIGEAAKQIPQNIKEKFNFIPWSSMAKSRDKMIHFYHGIDYDIIWEIITKDLQPLNEQLQKIYLILIEEEQNT